MITVDILHSTEFYVIMAVVAAAIMCLCVRPSTKGPSQTYFYSSQLLTSFPEDPNVTFRCLDSGNVEIIRTGLRGVVDSSGAVSVAVSVTGYDVIVQERITPTGRHPGEPVDAAVFELDCLAEERYHLRYVAADGTVSIMSLHNRPGITVSRAVRG